MELADVKLENIRHNIMNEWMRYRISTREAKRRLGDLYEFASKYASLQQLLEVKRSYRQVETAMQ